ncbi:MAG: Hpt domain-containing protein, partial [Deltaproteobacteria bacterium]|nr:Hpt domain-containing protein [Deltaproteobacteria bacterium]
PEKTPPARLAVPAGPVVPGAGYSGPGLGLLDMIITDEEAEVAPESDGARDAEPVVARPPVKPVPSVTVRVKPSPAKIPAPVLEPETVEPGAASAEESPIPATPSPAAGHAPISVPLPGEDDSVFKDMLPLIPGLIVELNDAMNDALRGKEEKSPLLVQEAAERVAGKAGSFGLTRLERMARCVERAAAADDVEPLDCVLAALEAWVARYKDALQKLHREAQW